MAASADADHTPAYDAVDLHNCEDEPIHIPGAIQPHGVLLAVEPGTLEVAVASANAGRAVGAPAAAAIGRPLSDVSGERRRRGTPPRGPSRPSASP